MRGVAGKPMKGRESLRQGGGFGRQFLFQFQPRLLDVYCRGELLIGVPLFCVTAYLKMPSTRSTRSALACVASSHLRSHMNAGGTREGGAAGGAPIHGAAGGSPRAIPPTIPLLARGGGGGTEPHNICGMLGPPIGGTRGCAKGRVAAACGSPRVAAANRGGGGFVSSVVIGGGDPTASSLPLLF